jgi:Kinesin motor domain
VFEQAAKNAVESFLDGQDCLVFAYGTTNAGKTFSVQGDLLHEACKCINNNAKIIWQVPRVSPALFPARSNKCSAPLVV